MQIKRSDVAKWGKTAWSYENLPVADPPDDAIAELFQQAKNQRATVFGELSPAVQAVLKNAVGEGRVQRFSGIEWECADDAVTLIESWAYRIHPDCQLVDDSRWVEWGVCQQDGQHLVKEKPEYASGRPLFAASSMTGYVCIKVRDATDDEFYLASWDGPYGHDITFNSVDDLVDGKNYIDGGATPLTPVAVVFEGGA